MPQTINNENEYRLTRSKVLQNQQEQAQTAQQVLQQTTQVHQQQSKTHSNSQDNNHNSSQQLSGEDVLINNRQYLGDVSKHYGSTGMKPGAVTSATANGNGNSNSNGANALKRRPLGGDNAPLQQQQRLITKSNNSNNNLIASQNLKTSNSSVSASSSSSSTTTNKLAIPSRLPQKRQATESSTNLVEKLHVANHNRDSSNAVSYKKSRIIDYEWQDLDEEDMNDPLMASEYVNDIFQYFSELEPRMLPDSQYLYKQKHLKPKMRSILVDWLVEMHLRFRLLPESLFLAINIMDRFMSLEVVQIDKLQLLATGSLFIAAKYEEVFSPSVKNYAYFTDGSYTEEEILQAEKYILTILNFDLNYPNPMNFLRRISKADDYDIQSRTLGKYLLEITAVDYKFIGMKPSVCCSSAMYLARLILGKLPVWNGNLIHYSGGYRVNDMKHCAGLIFQYLISPVEHDEFFKKYATRKFMKASILCRSWAKKFHSENKDLFDESLSTQRLSLDD